MRTEISRLLECIPEEANKEKIWQAFTSGISSTKSFIWRYRTWLAIVLKYSWGQGSMGKSESWDGSRKSGFYFDLELKLASMVKSLGSNQHKKKKVHDP